MVTGADPSAQTSAGVTALHAAAKSNAPGCVKSLLEAGAPQDALTSTDKATAFGFAVEEGYTKVATDLAAQFTVALQVIQAFRDYNGEEFNSGDKVALDLSLDELGKEVGN